MKLPTYTGVVAAADRIAPYVHRTPVLTSKYVDTVTGASVYFKAENFQKVGAFKARGATNAVLALSDDEAARGVVTHSSGNHGQAVAYACSIRGIRAVVVMPDHAPSIKIDAVRGYGAEVRVVPHTERQSTVDTLANAEELVVVHPFDDPFVIEGQGTATLELVEDVDDLNLVMTPIGGGGLLSGATLVGSHHAVPTIGAEPELVDDAHRSLRDGIRYPATGNLSVGDGLLTGIGELPYTILREANVEILTVSDDEMLDAMRTLATRMKIVVEPSGATVLAALVRYRAALEGQRVGAILSGGNVDLGRLSGA